MELHAKLSYSEIRTTSNLQMKAMSSYRYLLLLIYMHQFPKNYSKLCFWEERERVSAVSQSYCRAKPTWNEILFFS